MENRGCDGQYNLSAFLEPASPGEDNRQTEKQQIKRQSKPLMMQQCLLQARQHQQVVGEIEAVQKEDRLHDRQQQSMPGKPGKHGQKGGEIKQGELPSMLVMELQEK